jgi:hypothetical protein
MNEHCGLAQRPMNEHRELVSAQADGWLARTRTTAVTAAARSSGVDVLFERASLRIHHVQAGNPARWQHRPDLHTALGQYLAQFLEVLKLHLARVAHPLSFDRHHSVTPGISIAAERVSAFQDAVDP